MRDAREQTAQRRHLFALLQGFLLLGDLGLGAFAFGQVVKPDHHRRLVLIGDATGGKRGGQLRAVALRHGDFLEVDVAILADRGADVLPLLGDAQEAAPSL